MPTFRDNPYGAFNFLVSLGGPQGDGGAVIGGFSEVTGPSLEIDFIEYRNGNERFNTPRKVPGLHKVGDVTLKRGLIGSTDLFEWIKGVGEGTPSPRNVHITLLDESRNPVAVWLLRNAQPKKWTGPALNAREGGEVAIEELVLTSEGVEFE